MSILTRRQCLELVVASAAIGTLPGCVLRRTRQAPKLAVSQNMQSWMDAFSIPGSSIALIEDGDVTWQAAYGLRHTGRVAEIDNETVFEAASMSKPLFCYQVLRLIEQGRLELDRPLDEYLPKPYAPEEPETSRITARMVMTHTTGLPNWRSGDRKTAPLTLLARPGTVFTYSGEGFVYLQTVVASIVGEDINPYLQSRLLDPMGMSCSSYVWREQYLRNYAHGHLRDGTPNEYKFRSQVNTAASLYTTPAQYARYLRVLMGTLPIDESLQASTIEAMLTPDSEKRAGFRYGLGWGLAKTVPGRTIVYHGGANGSGHRCLCAFERESGLGFVVMTNGRGGSALRREVADVLFPGADLWRALG